MFEHSLYRLLYLYCKETQVKAAKRLLPSIIIAACVLYLESYILISD